MSTLLTPLVPPYPVRSKILFPSQPPFAPPPSLGSVAGGSLGATTYFVQITWLIQTQDGVTRESPAGNEASIPLGANQLLQVSSPPATLMPYALVGWNVYVGTSSGGESLQNLSPLAIGANFTEPATGLIGGAPPPTLWGNSFIFTFPGREFPYSNRDWKGHDEFSTAGWQQSITWYIDQLYDFAMPYIQDGNDVAVWDQFLAVCLQRVPFDFYLDSTQAQFITLVLTTTNPKLAWKAPGLWTMDFKARRAILTQ